MKVEQTLAQLGMAVPDLEGLYRTNPSGAHYISHFPMQNLLYLSGPLPARTARPTCPGWSARISAWPRGTRRPATPCSRPWRR